MRRPRSDAPSVVSPIIDRETGGVNASILEEWQKFGSNSLEPLRSTSDRARAIDLIRTKRQAGSNERDPYL